MQSVAFCRKIAPVGCLFYSQILNESTAQIKVPQSNLGIKSALLVLSLYETNPYDFCRLSLICSLNQLSSGILEILAIVLQKYCVGIFSEYRYFHLRVKSRY